MQAVLKAIDWLTIGYFCLEYVVRFVCAPNKAKFFFQAMNLVRHAFDYDCFDKNESNVFTPITLYRF
jgi:hypothetical protein